MRGCQKKVIFLKNTGSSLFDEAYFIISREGEKENIGENNMIVEANRIIESHKDSEKGSGIPLRHKLFILFGFVFGFVIGLGLCLILSGKV